MMGAMLNKGDYVFLRDFNTNYPIITHGKCAHLFIEDGESYIDRRDFLRFFDMKIFIRK